VLNFNLNSYFFFFSLQYVTISLRLYRYHCRRSLHRLCRSITLWSGCCHVL